MKGTKQKGFFKGYKEPEKAKKRLLGTNRDPCEICGLYKGTQTPRMKPHGQGKKKVYVLGEGPGFNEDQDGYQFHKDGKAGSWLRKVCKRYGLDLDEDCWKDNSIRCRTPRNRTPTDKEISACRSRVMRTWRELETEKMFLFGGPAVRSFLGLRMTDIGPVGKWVGWKIPDQDSRCWVYPMYHPSFIARDITNKPRSLKFNAQLKGAIHHSEPFPDYGDEAGKITLIQNTEDARGLLSRLIREKAACAFDYETTGLKPHAVGHRIVCMSISTDRESAWGFPMFDDRVFKNRLRKLLTKSDIPKRAHNLAFESNWTKTILGYEVRGWSWDTMHGAHCLDNRPGITGLKIQAYLNYGILGYDDDVASYLKSKSKSANAFNNIMEIWEKSPEKVLTYCGMDSMFTTRLAEDQIRAMPTSQLRGAMFFLDGAIELANVEAQGIVTNQDHCHKQQKILSKRITQLKQEINSSPEVKKWREATGKKEFNANSDPELKKVLYDIEKHKSNRQTIGGGRSVDQESLKGIGTPFTSMVLRCRKLDKLSGTYLQGFIDESVEGIMRPQFPLNFVRSYRGSSRSPNFTNIPARDEQAKRITRKALKPRPGHYLLDVDYSGIEVTMAACNTKDPELIRYVSDPSTDMHRDQAMALFMLEKEQVTKKIRYAGKNEFVFPEFYGSYFAQCAPHLWTTAKREKLESGITVKEHLKGMGIKSFARFERHVENEEDIFWNEKFKEYANWKEQVWEAYQKKGYVELLTGFRCSQLMGKNDVTNYPNQGPAFHCLLWSLIQLNQMKRERGWDSRIIGQIHDDLVWDMNPDEEEEIKPLIRQVMCEDIREAWRWIIVPLNIDAEASAIDGNWYEQEKVEI